MLHPSKVSPRDLSLFNFLGVLMGVCIRTNTNLALNLPSFVWKQLVGQQLTAEDLLDFDDGIEAELSDMVRCTSKDNFEEMYGGKYFTAMLSDGSTVDLVPNGHQKEVTFENRLDYVRRTLYIRMKECEQQCAALKNGICNIVPQALLNMVTYQELEEWIYGKKTIDIDLLKRHTKYAVGYGPSDCEQIKWFWEILEEMPQADKQKFIRFCYAQPTIPANDEEFDRRRVRMMIKPVQANRH